MKQTNIFETLKSSFKFPKNHQIHMFESFFEPRIIDASNWESELQEILGERLSIETITEEAIFE